MEVVCLPKVAGLAKYCLKTLGEYECLEKRIALTACRLSLRFLGVGSVGNSLEELAVCEMKDSWQKEWEAVVSDGWVSELVSRSRPRARHQLIVSQSRPLGCQRGDSRDMTGLPRY
jgi:hypothetical protein